jgi:hypothetical protein
VHGKNEERRRRGGGERGKRKEKKRTRDERVQRCKDLCRGGVGEMKRGGSKRNFLDF